jgi:hypothetical protein
MLELWQLPPILAQANPAPAGGESYYHGNQFVPLALALLFLGVTIELIRRRKLREEYAMLWLGSAVVMLAIAVFPRVVIMLQDALHVTYLTIVVLALFFFLAMIVMHFSIVISKQSEDIRQLAQRLAIMNNKLEEKDKDVERGAAGVERNDHDKSNNT